MANFTVHFRIYQDQQKHKYLGELLSSRNNYLRMIRAVINRAKNEHLIQFLSCCHNYCVKIIGLLSFVKLQF